MEAIDNAREQTKLRSVKANPVHKSCWVICYSIVVINLFYSIIAGPNANIDFHLDTAQLFFDLLVDASFLDAS